MLSSPGKENNSQMGKKVMKLVRKLDIYSPEVVSQVKKMKMPAALHCQFSVVLSLTHLFKPDFLRSWRDGLLLEFIILNLD